MIRHNSEYINKIILFFVLQVSLLTREKLNYLHAPATSLQGEIQEFFIAGGGGKVQILVQKGLLNFFVAYYFSPTPHPTSHWEGRDDYDYVFLNLWKPVAIGAGNTALQAEANRSLEGTQLQHIL